MSDFDYSHEIDETIAERELKPKRAKVSKISVAPANPNATKHRGVLFLEGVPEDTKQLFKAACARKGETMRDAMIRLMRDYVKAAA